MTRRRKPKSPRNPRHLGGAALPAFPALPDETRPFTAVEAAEAIRVPGYMPAPEPQPCRCDEHKYGKRPGAGIVLYAGPDTVDMLCAMAVRDGRYEDIRGSFDDVETRYLKGFCRVERHLDMAIESGYRRVAAVRRAAAARAVAA